MKVSDIRFEIGQLFLGCPQTIPAKRTPCANYMLIGKLPLAANISKEISEHFDVPYNVLKIWKAQNRATLLWYPNLGKCYHPRLHRSKILSIYTTGGTDVRAIKTTDYGESGAYPILHSIHMMLDKNTDPEWKKYADQDWKERRLKLFKNYNKIGQSRFWDDLVRVTPGTDTSFLSA